MIALEKRCMVKHWRTFFVLGLTILIVWFIKFVLHFPTADSDNLSIVLTVASIIFGLLAGFFISELWSRYTEIRSLQGERSAATLAMVSFARHFFKNKDFEKEFKSRMEEAAVSDMLIAMDEGHLEIPYYVKIEESFDKVSVKTPKDEQYFEGMRNSYSNILSTLTKMDILYKDTLFFTEWLIMIVLSTVIILSVLFMDASQFFSIVIILVFPPIIILALSIIYDIDNLTWGQELITLEPTQMALEAIGAKRFYVKEDLKFKSVHIKDFRTEDDLTGSLREVHDSILAKRLMEKGNQDRKSRWSFVEEKK
jgi:ABC-type multidrug transport system fused ATPase/permease subunit